MYVCVCVCVCLSVCLSVCKYYVTSKVNTTLFGPNVHEGKGAYSGPTCTRVHLLVAPCMWKLQIQRTLLNVETPTFLLDSMRKSGLKIPERIDRAIFRTNPYWGKVSLC